MSRRRVAVTGLGVVTPIGNDVAAFRDALLSGRSGGGRVTLFDPAELPTKIAAEVKWTGPILRDRKVTFALEAARQAFEAATARGSAPAGLGAVSAGIGLELFSMEDMAALRAGATLPATRQERLTFLQTPSDLCVHLIAKRYGCDAPPVVHVSACAAGTDAIGAAFRAIARGRIDWALAGGADSMINPLGLAGFCRIGATTTRNDEPERASRPFDRRRDGFLLGEGAGFLVLEALDAARARGAEALAEIAGYGCSLDALGISEPHPEGRGAVQAMRRAMAEAGVGPEDIDCVNAHGTSTPKNDPVETLAIKTVLGARRVPVCATKSMIGHLISAAGAVEAVAAIEGLRAGWVHPTINLDEPDPACDLDYVPHAARRHGQRCVISNSFGFGGQNASIVIRHA
jgi:3-oxoacyl-[acyl-carrier-protein] synthase II